MIYKRVELPEFNKDTIYSLNFWVVYFCWWKSGGGWARLFGNWYGIAWTRASEQLLFSERMGVTKYITLFGYRWKILNPAFKVK